MFFFFLFVFSGFFFLGAFSHSFVSFYIRINFRGVEHDSRVQRLVKGNGLCICKTHMTRRFYERVTSIQMVYFLPNRRFYKKTITVYTVIRANRKLPCRARDVRDLALCVLSM